MAREEKDIAGIEGRLRAYFRAEVADLAPPTDLWESLSPRLGRQRPTGLIWRLPTLRRRWLVAVPVASLLLAVLAVAYVVYNGEGVEAPPQLAKETEVRPEEVKAPAEIAKEPDAPAEVAKEPEAPAEVAREKSALDLIRERAKQDQEQEPEQEDFAGTLQARMAMADEGLVVTIGPRGGAKTNWAVDVGESTMSKWPNFPGELEYVKVGTGLDLVGVALADRSEAPLAGVYVHGNYAFVGGMSVGYVTSNNVGVRILDISDPTGPELVGRIPLRSRQVKGYSHDEEHSHGDAIATDIESDAFQGDIAIVGHGVPDTYTVDDYPMSFGIWDVSEPGNLKLLSVLSLGYYSYMHEEGDLGDKPEDAKAVHGNYFYVVYNKAKVTDFDDSFSYDFHLAVVDLSDPRNPLVISDWDPPDDTWLYSVSLNQSGTRAYIAGIAGPPPAGSEEKAGHIDQFGFSRVIIYVLDIQDPGAPVQIARHVYPYPGPWVHRPRAVPNEDESLLILADGRWGDTRGGCVGWGRLHILDISDLGSIYELATFAIAESDTCRGDEKYTAWDMAVKGDLVYSTWLTGGLHVVDISDPTNPVAVGEFRSPDNRGPWLSDVALYSDESGDYAFASTVWWSGLYVLKLR